MPKATCVKCAVYLRPQKNDVRVVETAQRDFRTPYAIWNADLWRCPSCGLEVVLGFGAAPEFEQWQGEGFHVALANIEKPYYCHEY